MLRMYASATSFRLARSVLHHPLKCVEHSGSPVSVCRASTSSKRPFPFPSHTNPTPLEIFHLPRSASQDEIKTRYYELVKVYHPDTAHGRQDIPPSVRNARFRAITHAYGILRGRAGLISKGAVWGYRDEAIRAELRRRSRRSTSSATTMATNGARHENSVDAQVWYSLVALVLLGTITAMSSIGSHMDRVERHTQSAAANLTLARAEAQLYGMERRRKIRERVRSFYETRETESGRPEVHTPSKI